MSEEVVVQPKNGKVAFFGGEEVLIAGGPAILTVADAIRAAVDESEGENYPSNKQSVSMNGATIEDPETTELVENFEINIADRVKNG